MSTTSNYKNNTPYHAAGVRGCIIFLLIVHVAACSSLTDFLRSSPSDHARIERHAGFTAYQKQDYPAALRHYQNALAYLPANNGDALRADVYYKIGRTHLKLQNNIAAIESFEQALALRINDSGHAGLSCTICWD